jgi:formate dehydrogenase major subunit
MLLTKKSSDVHPVHRTGSARFVQSLSRGLSNALPTMDRRAFLRRSGLGVGVGLAATQLTLVKKATGRHTGRRRRHRENRSQTHGLQPLLGRLRGRRRGGKRRLGAPGAGVRLAHQPGAHCAKGAALREHGHGEYRLRYPMKLVNGKYERISWDTALNEISARLLELRKESGPDSVYWVGLRSTTTSRPT